MAKNQQRLYKLRISRTITKDITIYGDSPADAKEKFLHQLEMKECSQVDSFDNYDWHDALDEADPYESEYKVLDVAEVVDDPLDVWVVVGKDWDINTR